MQILLNLHSKLLWIMIIFFFNGFILKSQANQRVKVNFFQSPKGKWLSFLNLKASFRDPDAVDVESNTKMNKDYDHIEDDEMNDENDVTIIYITPQPILQSAVPPKEKSLFTLAPEPFSDFQSKLSATTQETDKSEIVSELDVTKLTTVLPTVPMEKDLNSVPGMMNLNDFIIPHKLRHQKKHQSKITENYLTRASYDDEDYGSDSFEGSATEMTTALPSTTTTEDVTTSFLPTTEADVESSTLVDEDENGKFDNETYYYDDEFFSNGTLIPREILHFDSLGRNETILRDLLANLTHLEVKEDYEFYYRDHGGSFLLPILKTVDYDNSSVPIVFPDIPLNVLVKLNVLHLSNFDTELMEYTIDLEMEMRWFDVRLANNYSKPIRLREKELFDKVFRPDPYFVNSKHSYFHIVSFPNFRMRIMPTGLVIYTVRVTLSPSCSMTFCRFPHDSQQCDLMISSIAYPKTFVNLMWNLDAITFATPVTLPELQIKKVTTENCVVEGKLIASSCLRLVFALERDGARYMIEKYVPSTLAMMFAWVAPYVPYNYEDVRIITPITVLLTLVQMEKGDLQIRTSYLTSLDIWFGAMKTFSVISLIESLVVLALVRRSRAMQMEAQKTPSEYKKEIFESEKRRLKSLYHRLDSASRYFSPIVFIIFVVYYVLYIAQRDETQCSNQNFP
uniref:Neurotransmitter-gated ion-channel ligand-binding domain-containing protein n=1 Tax=Panagrolaimus sp. JU765 TaxID=591449 RepID=A0AC34R9W9_9BILA